MDIGTIITVGVLLATAFYKLGDRRKKDVQPIKSPDLVVSSDPGSDRDDADKPSVFQPVEVEPENEFSCGNDITGLPDSTKKEPVDKRKLIVYSEIMKPKYLE